jgi:N utilization substance protein B
MERLNKVTLAILRTSIYEMKYLKGSEKGIVIDEAINISKQYGSDDSYKFINAVLDKIGKDEKKA